MGLLNPKSFIYDGKNSDDFNIAIGYFDSPDFSQNGLTREIVKGETGMTRKRANHYGTTEDPIVMTFSILPSVCGSDNSTWTQEEWYQINQWLTTPTIPKKIHFNDNESMFVNYYGLFTQVDDVLIGGRNGKTVTFTTDAPYAYSDILAKSILDDGTGKTLRYRNMSDIGNYYPKLTFTWDSSIDGTIDFAVKNVTDNNKEMIFSVDNTLFDAPINCVIIDGKRQMITDKYGNIIPMYKLGITPDSVFNWFKLVSGINQIVFTGNGTFKIESEFPMKVGVV